MRLMLMLSLLILALLIMVPIDAVAEAKVLDPLVAGWEHIFKVDWEVSEHRGRPVLSGHLENGSPYTLTQIRLLVEGLDEAGGIVSQRIVWVPIGTLMPFGRTYYEAPVPGRHAKYQVRVFSFDRIETDGSSLP
jgi:hypothetical protein